MLNKKGLQLQAFLFDSWRALSFTDNPTNVSKRRF